ncbi:MAG: hypothetical protein WAW42_15545 [Candidatus Competibacteraceae bacterium]
MLIGIFLVDKAVVVDEIPVAGIVRRVDVDALDLAGVGHAQKAQSVEIVAFDDEIAKRRYATGQVRIEIQRHEILVDGFFMLDFVALPHQAEFRLAVAFAEQADEFFAGVIVVVVSHAVPGTINLASAAIRVSGSKTQLIN